MYGHTSEYQNSVCLSEKPDLRKAALLIRDALAKKRGLIAIGKCCVEYKGRAFSILEQGQRIVIAKCDGSMLVHRPIGYEPVNWQPPGSRIHVRVDAKSSLVLRAIRSHPREILDVLFDRIDALVSCNLIDEGQFYLHVTEVQMREALLCRPGLIEEGLRIISYERKIEPGFIDVYARDKEGRLVVVEIKRNPAGKSAVLQLRRYLDAISRESGVAARGIIASPSLKRGSQTLLAALRLEFKPLPPRKCLDVLQQHVTRKLSDYFEHR